MDAWCDEASIGEAATIGFVKWAERLVEYPPAERMSELLHLRKTEQLGTHMAAAACFEAGDLIISENAVMRLPPLTSRAEEQLAREFGSKASFLGPALAVNWKNVAPEVREAVLGLFWAHPILETAKSRLVGETRDACRALINKNAALRDCSWEVESLLRFLHIVDLNIHRDGEARQNAEHAGLFVLGSKFSNSCAPNCRWSFTPNGCLQYHAIRRIEPGDLLTFSYIGNGMSLVEGTVARRRRLGNLWFVCQCSRCMQPDVSRQMWCPRCKSPGCIPGESREAEGVDWTGDAPLREVIAEPSTWVCRHCGSRPAASEMPLEAEDEVSQLVPQVMDKGPDTAKEDLRTAEKLINQIEQEVGPHHWTRILAIFAWLQKALMLLRTANIIDFHEGLLQERCKELARWFEENMPDGVEQRLSVLYLVVRLSQNFEDALPCWGFSPDDPLGNGSQIAKRMVQDSRDL
mmetsp:Transcript_47867/g.113755  ORF Transcript_47867/g.113755 Transcript_47867/m.113755 type:complete len:463 (+) Transcript_47867:113-1501(+)